MAVSAKVAVVTGAATGIGKAMTEILLQNGAKVVLLDVDESAGKSLKEALNQQFGPDKTLFLTCNVESQEQVKAAFQKTVETFGGIDIVCNNAGVLNEAEWEKSVSINLLGVMRVTHVALQHMNKLTGGGGGVIVNTASMAGLTPLVGCPAYTASKYGVVGFTRAMEVRRVTRPCFLDRVTLQLKPDPTCVQATSTASGYGIRFNALCPGFVQTELFTSLSPKLGPFSNVTSEVQTVVNRGSIKPSEVAECLLELVTDETKNGEALIVKYNLKKYMTFAALV